MEEQNRNYGTRSVVGAILIIIGGLFMLKSLNIIYFNIPNIIFSGAFVTFIIGILILVNSRKRVLGAIITLIGIIWLLPRIFPIHINGGVIFSVAVIGLGIYIILRQRGKTIMLSEGQADSAGIPNPVYSDSDRTLRKDYLDEVSIFGGGFKMVNSENFRGGSITAIFGGSEIDLTTCKLAEGTSIVDVLALFGGAEIHVPRDWNVVVNTTPIFGGFSNKIVRDPNRPVDTSKTLVIKGLAMFGGIEINSKEKGYVF